MLYWHEKKCKRNNQHAVNLLHRKVLLLSETIKLIDPAKTNVSFFFFF